MNVNREAFGKRERERERNAGEIDGERNAGERCRDIFKQIFWQIVCEWMLMDNYMKKEREKKIRVVMYTRTHALTA